MAATGPRTILFVHAHPDDEAIGTGGTILRYGREGVRTVVVCCTGGEAGEISDPALATPDNLGEVRRRELEAAAEILGLGRLVWLGYRDSGMADTADNDNPASFHRADMDEAVGRLVRIVREERPQVIVSYDPNGSYGHPDHVRAYRIAQAAFWTGGDPTRFPEAGPPWTPSKLYETVITRTQMERFAQAMRDADVERPPGEDEWMRERVLRYAVPDSEVTTRIEFPELVDEKRRAVLAHATQMGPRSRFGRVSPELFRQLWVGESYRRVAGPYAPGSDGVETDLFSGL
jgi:N-acetyl-1-D-myo-inositol-2-amino-2-deoxy-alpha-D-glucopyranoside deacetylase